MSLLTICGFSAALFYAAFWFGGTHESQWNISLAILGLTGLLDAVFSRHRLILSAPRRSILWLCSSLLGIAALQTIPIPTTWIDHVSPARKQMLDAAERVTPVPAKNPLSATPSATLEELLTIASFLLVMFTMRQIASQFSLDAWWCAAPLILLATAEAGLGMFQFYAGDGIARGTFVNRNHFAALLEMIFLFPIMWSVQIFSRRTRNSLAGIAICGLSAAAALILAGIVHSFSRMGFISCLISSFVAGLTMLGTRRTAVKTRWVPAGVFAIIILLALIFLPSDTLIRRFGSLAESKSLTSETRIQIWRETLLLIQDYPVFGCGLGSFESCFAQYKRVEPSHTVEYAHNDYLQFAAEAGIPGLAVLIALALMAAGRIVRAIRDQRRYLALACLGAVVAIGLHSLVDFSLHIPANGMTLAWILAIV